MWQAYVDPTTWSEWFPGVRSAGYRGAGPHGIGSIREATVGRQRYEEVIVAWEEPARWAYYVARASLPIARAHLECTEFEDCGSGTRVRWVVATDRRLLLRLAAPALPRVLEGLFRKAMRNLDARIAAGRRASPSS